MTSQSSEPPREWIDPDTGHRIKRISDEPGSSSLYFNFNGCTPSGDYLIISTPHGISKIHHPTFELTPIIEISEPFRLLFAGRKIRRAFYVVGDGGKGRRVMAVDIDSGRASLIWELPDSAEVQSISSDDTTLAGIQTYPDENTSKASLWMDRRNRDPGFSNVAFDMADAHGRPIPFAVAKGIGMEERFEAKIPNKIFLYDITNGKRRDLHECTTWLNHLQFSPTDPNLLMFCHEGPWHKVMRLWLLNTAEPDHKPMAVHKRSMNMEIWGHEWFSADGKVIWYDLQLPRGEDFWLAGYHLDTGAREWYHLTRDEWSVHFNSTRDGSKFTGDGGDGDMVAHAKDGKWIYLFTPESMEDEGNVKPEEGGEYVRPGVLKAERLVNMDKHDYTLEPNCNFTPEGHWVIFRSNMHGGTQVYAVEVTKSDKS